MLFAPILNPFLHLQPRGQFPSLLILTMTLSASIDDVDLKIVSILPFTTSVLGVHFPTPPQSQPPQKSSIKPINNSLTLLNNLTAFYQRECFWIHHTHTALKSTLAFTVNGRITLSADIHNVNSKLSSSTLSSITSFSEESDYTVIVMTFWYVLSERT